MKMCNNYTIFIYIEKMKYIIIYYIAYKTKNKDSSLFVAVEEYANNKNETQKLVAATNKHKTLLLGTTHKK